MEKLGVSTSTVINMLWKTLLNMFPVKRIANPRATSGTGVLCSVCM